MELSLLPRNVPILDCGTEGQEQKFVHPALVLTRAFREKSGIKISSSLKGSRGTCFTFCTKPHLYGDERHFRDMDKRELSSPAPSPSPGVLIGHEPPLRLNPRFVPWAYGLGKARDYQSLHEGCVSQSQCVSTRQGLCSIEWTRRRRMQLMLPKVQRLDVVQRIPVEG